MVCKFIDELRIFNKTARNSPLGLRCVFLHCVSKNDTNVAHYNYNAHQLILVLLAQMLLREYVIK